MKEYFPHDYNARTDPKLQNVMMELGVAGIGVYWCVIEQLYEQGGRLPLNGLNAIAFTLHVETEVVTRLISDFGLFESDEECFWSASVAKRVQKREDIGAMRSVAGKAGVEKRWREYRNSKCIANAIENDSKCIANAIENDSKCIAIKEKEIKESINTLSGTRGHARVESASSEAERETFFKIFFFRNILNPEIEVEAFCNYYEANGWRRSGGIRISDKAAACREWKPKSDGRRFSLSFLSFWKVLYTALGAKEDLMLHELMGAEEIDRFLILKCTESLRDFLERNVDTVKKFIARYYRGLKYRISAN